MKENILTKIKVNIDKDDTANQMLEDMLKVTLPVCDNVYSYLIYSTYKETMFTGWEVEFLVSQDDKYNTLPIDDVAIDVIKTILKDKKQTEHSYVVGYKQPSIDIMCDVYEPCIKKLARVQKQHWPQFEYEDLCQICRLVMVTLYKKGYYINKLLLEKSFINYILMQLRKERYKPIIVGFDAVFSRCEGQEDITFADIMPDINEMYEQQDKEDEEEQKEIDKMHKETIIKYIGQRRYDQLVREYGSKTTSSAGTRTIYVLKEKLRRDGLL